MLYIASAIFKFTRLQTSGETTRDHLYDLINKYRPTATLASPTLMMNLLAEGERQRCDFTCFETGIFGGSYVPQIIFEILKEVAPDCEPELGLGMTELGGIVLAYETEYPKGCVGKPSPHLHYRLVDPITLEDISEPNKTGELWCKGPTVTKGYYNNPEATKQVFTEDGWFRSGDLLRRDEQNHYYYVDRLKMLLKYRNHQISPIELEGVIRQHPGVHDAVVVGIPDLECGDLPAAFVVVRNGHKVTAQEIKDIVKDNLTDSKQLRGGVIFLKELPLTVTNKVDRVKLKKMAPEMERE